MKKSALISLLILFSFTAIAQKGIIRGFVYDKENSEPVIFTNVYLKGSSYGSPTDINGFFTITQIPAGTYELMITYLGYDTLRESITIKPGEIITRKYYLEKGARSIKEVQIGRDDDTTQTLISKKPLRQLK